MPAWGGDAHFALAMKRPLSWGFRSFPMRPLRARFPPEAQVLRFMAEVCLAQIAVIRRRLRGQVDPFLTFKIGPMNGRKARESGLRQKAHEVATLQPAARGRKRKAACDTSPASDSRSQFSHNVREALETGTLEAVLEDFQPAAIPINLGWPM